MGVVKRLLLRSASLAEPYYRANEIQRLCKLILAIFNKDLYRLLLNQFYAIPHHLLLKARFFANSSGDNDSENGDSDAANTWNHDFQ